MLKIATKMDAVTAILTSNRFKSFYWRTGAMIVAGLIQVLLDSAADLQLNSVTTVLLGLVLGEITKFLNTK